MTLFIANMWHDVFISQSVINKAMQLVARQRAKGEVLNCLRAFLNWEKVRLIFSSCNTILADCTETLLGFAFGSVFIHRHLLLHFAH